MADFKAAYEAVVAGHEGGWVNDPDDPGGETICGVARNKRPEWPAWPIVDEVKNSLSNPSPNQILNSCMAVDKFKNELQRIYYMDYWMVFYGDSWPDHLQKNAVEVFDSQVNTGKGIEFLQQGLNLLNRNGSDWPDVVEDNVFGPATWAAVQACVEKRSPDLLLILQNQCQGEHYTRLMRRRPHQFQRYVGWFSRLR